MGIMAISLSFRCEGWGHAQAWARGMVLPDWAVAAPGGTIHASVLWAPVNLMTSFEIES